MNASLSASTNIDPYSAEFITAVKQWVDTHFESIVGDLTKLVSYQSLAFADFDRSQLDASAQAVVELFTDSGLEQVQRITETSDDGGQSGPAIIGRKIAAKHQPTVLLYAHHDVQPVGELDAWHTDPWTATEKAGRTTKPA